MIVAILLITLALLVLVKQLKRYYYFESYVKDLKSVYPTVPVFGSVFSVMGKSITEVCNDFVEFLKANESPVKSYLGTELVVTLDEPEDLKMLLTSPHCINRPFIFEFLPCPKGVSAIHSGVQWKSLRKHMNPSFSPIVLQSFVPILNSILDTLFESMDNHANGGEEFDVLPYMNVTTLEGVCATLMGFRIDVRKDIPDGLFESIEAITSSERFGRPWMYFNSIYKWTNLYKEEQRHLTNLRLIANKIYSEGSKRYSFAKKVENKPKVLIDNLFELISSGEFDEELVKQQIETLVLAGVDTSSTTLSFAFLMLAIHPEIQQTVYDELRTVFNSQDEETTNEHLNRLVYLDAVIKETMRLFPAGPFPFRMTTKDIAISKCTIPKETNIMPAIYSVHRRQDIWGDDADAFNPDHFSAKNTSKRHPFAFIPFSQGPRNCIGHRYAMISIKVLLSSVLRRYRLRTSLKMSDIDLKLGMVLRLNNKYKLQIERRSW